MFDWNDEELTNIIWGDAGDSEDHIVPYQEGSKDYHDKKEWSQETTTIKHAENRFPGAKIEIHGKKLESSPNFSSNETISAAGSGMGSWSDLSLSNASKAGENPMGAEVSNNIDEITKNNSTTGAVKTEIDEDPDIFRNSHEDKDQGDFVDYSWANIGSFDDLDRIFSNDDPIFGRVSLDSADELWPSSKDVPNSPVKSFTLAEDSPNLELGALKNTAEPVEVKLEFERQDDQLLTLSHGKLSNSAQSLQNEHPILDHVEYPGAKCRPKVKEQTDLGIGRSTSALNSCLVAENVMTPDNFANKGYRQKNLLKGQKKLEERVEGELLQDFYGTWSPAENPTGKYENELAHSVLHSSPSPVLSQQRQLKKSGTLQHQQQIPNSFVSPSTYGNLTNQYPAMPVLSHIQAGEFKRQPLSSCYEVPAGKSNSVTKSAAAPAKTMSMTPQEKIEKLRRRQQMQAMLAIQKQQQQFSHQVFPRDQSIPQKFQENQIQHVEGADLEVEDPNALPSFDPNSPVEQDDSKTIYLAFNNYSVEEAVLYRLQDVIAKLDVRIRLCIRDSLFRLAQSAMQRHYASDTSSTNKSSRDEPEVVAETETNSATGYARMPDAETETNPIDRTVAHLLFHRPLELSGKHPETPESPASTKLPCELGTMNLVNLPVGCIPETSNLTQNFSLQGSKDRCLVPEPQLVDPFKSSPGIDTSENASNYGPADGGAADVEPSL